MRTCPKKSPSLPKSLSQTSTLSCMVLPLSGADRINRSPQTGLQSSAITLVFPIIFSFQKILTNGSLSPNESALPSFLACSTVSSRPLSYMTPTLPTLLQAMLARTPRLQSSLSLHTSALMLVRTLFAITLRVSRYTSSAVTKMLSTTSSSLPRAFNFLFLSIAVPISTPTFLRKSITPSSTFSPSALPLPTNSQPSTPITPTEQSPLTIGTPRNGQPWFILLPRSLGPTKPSLSSSLTSSERKLNLVKWPSLSRSSLTMLISPVSSSLSHTMLSLAFFPIMEKLTPFSSFLSNSFPSILLFSLTTLYLIDSPPGCNIPK
mmetsp:Transcript_16999/g.35023  ORF Transcript_16999/g.35023 Transcript_16999/m.35023 type:complete len:320 (-) Transcript_16999:1558-2517(-)